MVAVPVEPRCRDPKHWGAVGSGTVGLVLGCALYKANFSDEARFSFHIVTVDRIRLFDHSG